MNKYIIAFLVIIILDILFISLVLKPKFEIDVKNIQKEELQLNMKYAVLAYIGIFLLFAYFVIYKKLTLMESFLLGFLTYAIFDLTNLAMFKQYNFKTAIIDMFWGGTLFLITNIIIKKISTQ